MVFRLFRVLLRSSVVLLGLLVPMHPVGSNLPGLWGRSEDWVGVLAFRPLAFWVQDAPSFSLHVSGWS